MVNVINRIPCVITLLCITISMSFSLMACADNNSSELHTKFVDADVQDKFTARLSSEGIPYRQTADGTVWYPAKEYDRVERISQEIVKSDYRGYTIHYDNPEHVRLFREKLTLQDIPFQARVRGNKELTSWNAADDSKVQNIIIEVRKIIIEERKAEILEKRRNN